MEQEKNNKGVIVLLVVIIVILATLCALLATGVINLNSNAIIQSFQLPCVPSYTYNLTKHK